MAGEFRIDALTSKGEGVGASKDGRVYIDRALPGDRIEAKMRRDIDGVLRGDVLAIVEPSPHRVAPPCPHYALCGGCTIQHASDAFYRDWKTGIVRDALAAKRLNPKIWRAPIFLPPGGRRRITFTAEKQGNTVTLGYSRRRQRQVVAIEACLVADPAIIALRPKLAPLLVPILQEGKPATAFVQTVGGQVEIVITGPVGAHRPPDTAVREAMTALAGALAIDRLSWRAHLGDAPAVIIEHRPISVRFGALDVALPPLGFLQPTPAGEAALVAAVMAALPAAGHFADLFAGSGTFTGPMLARGSVDAFENVVPTIRMLDEAKSGLPLEAMRRDLCREPLSRAEAERYDAIVFDPPRAGAEAQVKELAGSAVPVLVGVSCNPATFARDARILIDGGYRLDSVQVIDQFTFSHHVELVASFSKQRA
ncbi:MAG TPA: class I SAM-dependent RNA methyltransferase [Stellaceae bacterium]|jgi:23S rRNA (uracil1939-C5)-methyltransferase|nr:class I SAM-dependent RNA methyltransferase [Stellaceae bacterium]